MLNRIFLSTEKEFNPRKRKPLLSYLYNCFNVIIPFQLIVENGTEIFVFAHNITLLVMKEYLPRAVSLFSKINNHLFGFSRIEI